MQKFIYILLVISIFSACSEKKAGNRIDFIIARGQMPAIVKDGNDRLHLVYGSGDSLMYTNSIDLGNSFSTPILIAVLPQLATSHTRGPQIAASNSGLTVMACNALGDIFSYNKTGTGNWVPTAKVNDIDTVAKENFLALGGNEERVFAVWLDLRGDRQNKIYGSTSTDGGKTWAGNKMIYASPDGTVCQCCKPSVAVSGNNVYVMFRNWLKGNRDMYLIQSNDGGNTFGEAQQLGNGNWKLNGCPMDGGDLAINKNGQVQSVWRREGKVYAATPGMPEVIIAEGKGCTMESINGKNVYAFTENGVITVLYGPGKKVVAGKGNQPVLQALNNEQVLCIWEDNKQIHASVLVL